MARTVKIGFSGGTETNRLFSCRAIREAIKKAVTSHRTNPIPTNDIKQLADPVGDEWDFDDETLCEEKLPKLWAMFGK